MILSVAPNAIELSKRTQVKLFVSFHCSVYMWAFIAQLLISGRVDRASATETVNSGSIPGRVKPKTINIGIHSLSAWRSTIKKDSVKPPPCGRQMGRWQLD